MLKSELYRALRTELHRHDFSTFVGEPPAIARGGNGVVVTGCPTCRKKFGTMPQFLDHLTDDVLPAILDRLSQGKVWRRGVSLSAAEIKGKATPYTWHYTEPARRRYSLGELQEITNETRAVIEELTTRCSPGELKEMGEKLNMAGQAFDISPPSATPSLSPA